MKRVLFGKSAIVHLIHLLVELLFERVELLLESTKVVEPRLESSRELMVAHQHQAN